MRNIFQVCYNTYRNSNDAYLTDRQALRQLTFSPRLFEVKLSVRTECATYLQECDTFVACEGEAARYCNLHTGNKHDISKIKYQFSSIAYSFTLFFMVKYQFSRIYQLIVSYCFSCYVHCASSMWLASTWSFGLAAIFTVLPQCSYNFSILVGYN